MNDIKKKWCPPRWHLVIPPKLMVMFLKGMSNPPIKVQKDCEPVIPIGSLVWKMTLKNRLIPYMRLIKMGKYLNIKPTLKVINNSYC